MAQCQSSGEKGFTRMVALCIVKIDYLPWPGATTSCFQRFWWPSFTEKGRLQIHSTKERERERKKKEEESRRIERGLTKGLESRKQTKKQMRKERKRKEGW